MVPSEFSFSFSASDGRFSGSMYSTSSCFVTYWYSSRRLRNRSKSSVRAKTVAFTGLVSPCSTFFVWSDSEYWLAAVRSHRLLCRSAR